MKLYLGMFGLLVVIVIVAAWPKPEDQRQDEEQRVPEPAEKKAGIETPKGPHAIEDDLPASKDGMKVTFHRRRAGESGEDGWYLAESTEGGFAVKLPNMFNDLTGTTKSRDGVPITMHTVATRTEDETQYSVSRGNRTDKKPIPEVLEGFAKSQGAGLKEKHFITQAGMQGIQTKAVVGPTAGICRILVNETTTYMLTIENRTGTVITPAMERNAPIFFESFRLK